MQQTTREHLLTATVSALLAAAIAWGWLARRERTRRSVGTVELVDLSGAFDRALAEREARPEPEPPAAPGGPLVSEADRARLAAILPSSGGRRLADPLTFYRLKPRVSERHEFPENPEGFFLLETNDLGFRNDEDVLSKKPDLRVLVTGDSHTEGLCSNRDSFCTLLEGELGARRSADSVETLNAGVSSYQHFHYLGVIERYGPMLAPDVIVIVFFGGNDFAGAMKFQHYFRSLPRFARGPYKASALQEAGLTDLGFVDQEIEQLCYFLDNTADLARVAELNVEVSLEIQRLSALHGARPLIVYLPPPSRGQPERYRADMQRVARALDVDLERLALTDPIADAWMEELEARGIEHLDLRPLFRSTREALYWRTDGHLNLRGHQLVAQALALAIESLLAR